MQSFSSTFRFVCVRTAELTGGGGGAELQLVIWLTRLYQMLSCVSDNTAK